MTQNTAAAALRADLAGPRVSAARLYSAAEIIGHAADRLREYAEAPPIGTIAPGRARRHRRSMVLTTGRTCHRSRR